MYSDIRASLVQAADLDVLVQHAEAAPPGALVEVGVYRGGSARRLYDVAKQQGRELFLFDTFEGHPPSSEHDKGHQLAGRFADCVDPVLLQYELPQAEVVIGRFPDSLWFVLPPVAFAHIDVDQYESTRGAIETIKPLLVPGGVLYFDDYWVADCPGCTKAVDELCKERVVLPNGKAIWTNR